MPGESTTDNESENEIVSQHATQSAVKANKQSKKQSPKNTQRKYQATSAPIFKPPAGLHIKEKTTNAKKQKHLPGH